MVQGWLMFLTFRVMACGWGVGSGWARNSYKGDILHPKSFMFIIFLIWDCPLLCCWLCPYQWGRKYPTDNSGLLSCECRFFYASSACIYPEFKQLETNVSLKESDAWPAEVHICFCVNDLETKRTLRYVLIKTV